MCGESLEVRITHKTSESKAVRSYNQSFCM